MQPIAIRNIIPDALGSRSMKINPWVRAEHPCVTLTKSFHDFQLWTRAGIRNLTIQEATKIASFPDVFQWTDARHGRERIGNSVPPKFMQAIAEHIYAIFLSAESMKITPSKPLDFVDKPINPPGPYKFTVISTFAGCGGSSLGYKWAGGKVLAAIEWDENAVATYRLNHQGTPVLHRDIATVTVEELLDLTGLQLGELDILDGSPPCQGFSTAGKRQIDDPRNSLFREYVRLLRGLQPKVFVMENVSGMVKGHMKHVFAIIMRELKASGYQVKCQLMNAMYFGVPQSRERVIFIGVRNDLGMTLSHPQAETRPPTVEEAWVDVQDDGTGHRVGAHTKIYQAMRHVKPGETQPGHYSHTRLQWNAPACTLQRAGGLGHYHFWHPVQQRVITLAECKRLASFPDAFRFLGTVAEAWDRIGNCVPPRFMYAIAGHIFQQIISRLAPAVGD